MKVITISVEVFNLDFFLLKHRTTNMSESSSFIGKNATLSVIVWSAFLYSESQIYEYKQEFFYNVIFSTYLGSNAVEKRV